jgi:hypothetical protein
MTLKAWPRSPGRVQGRRIVERTEDAFVVTWESKERNITQIPPRSTSIIPFTVPGTDPQARVPTPGQHPIFRTVAPALPD